MTAVNPVLLIVEDDKNNLLDGNGGFIAVVNDGLRRARLVAGQQAIERPVADLQHGSRVRRRRRAGRPSRRSIAGERSNDSAWTSATGAAPSSPQPDPRRATAGRPARPVTRAPSTRRDRCRRCGARATPTRTPR